MPFPTVGVLAVVEGMQAFRKDTDEIKTRLTQLEQSSRQAASGTGILSAGMGGLGGVLKTVGSIAAGIIAADIFRGIARQIGDMASSAFDAAKTLQKLDIQFETLVARELRASNTTEGFAQHLRESGAVSDYQVQRFINLRNAHDLLIQKMDETDLHTVQGRQNFEQFGNRLQWVDGQIRALIPGFEGLDRRLQESAFGTYTFTEALEDAKGPGKALLDWALAMSITTPFRPQTIADAVSLSMAMGFQTDETKRLVTAVGNFTAGMGLSDEIMVRIIHNFGQMRSAGKVTGTELRDLARGAFVPVNDIIAKMQQNLGMTGMSFDAFKKAAGEGAFGVDAFFEAFMQITESDFQGAMQRMSGTWIGVTQDLQDFFNVIMGANVLKPVLEMLSGGLRGFIDSMADPDQIAKLDTTRGLTSDILANIEDIATDIADLLGIEVSPGSFIDTINNFLRDIAIPIAQLRALTSGETTLADLLDRLGFTEDQKGRVSEIAGWFTPLGDGLGKFADALVGLTPAAQDALKGIMEQLALSVNEALPGILDSLGTIFGHMGDSLKEQGPSIIDVLGKTIELLITVPIATLDAVTSALAALLLVTQGDWEGAGEKMAGFRERFVNMASGLVGFEPGEFEAMFEDIDRLIGIIVEHFWTQFQTSWAETRASLDMTEEVDALIADIAADFTAGWQSIADMMGGLGAWQGVWNNLITIRNELLKRGGELIQGLWDGVKAKVDEFLGWLTDKYNEILALWDKIFHSGSPSREMMERGEGIMAGLQKGMKDGLSGVEKQMATIGAGIIAQPQPAMAAASSVTNARTIIFSPTITRDVEGMVLLEKFRDAAAQG